MYKIVHKETLAPKIHVYEIEAPLVVRHAQPGQFVILRVDEKGERIPLTIFHTNKENYTWYRGRGSHRRGQMCSC